MFLGRAFAFAGWVGIVLVSVEAKAQTQTIPVAFDGYVLSQFGPCPAPGESEARS